MPKIKKEKTETKKTSKPKVIAQKRAAAHPKAHTLKPKAAVKPTKPRILEKKKKEGIKPVIKPVVKHEPKAEVKIEIKPVAQKRIPTHPIIGII